MNDNNINTQYWKHKNYTSIDLRNLAVSKVLDDNKSIEESAAECKICTLSLKTYITRKIMFGTVESKEEIKKRNNKKYKRKHKRTKIDSVVGAVIHGLIQEDPLTLDQLKNELDALGFEISRTAICKYMYDCQLTLKVITKVANESNPHAIREFWEDFYSLCTDYKQIFALDESWRNNRTVNRKKGRSKRGTRCIFSVNLTRGRYKINLLLATNWNGPICWDMFPASVDREDILFFFETQLGQYINPYPGPNSILIMDNHYSHESSEIFEWLDSRGVQILYEPAHYPIINLTEWNFGAIKGKERRKGVFGSLEQAVDSLNESIEECIGLNWKGAMNRIGFIDAITDSD